MCDGCWSSSLSVVTVTTVIQLIKNYQPCTNNWNDDDHSPTIHPHHQRRQGTIQATKINGVVPGDESLFVLVHTISASKLPQSLVLQQQQQQHQEVPASVPDGKESSISNLQNDVKSLLSPSRRPSRHHHFDDGYNADGADDNNGGGDSQVILQTISASKLPPSLVIQQQPSMEPAMMEPNRFVVDHPTIDKGGLTLTHSKHIRQTRNSSSNINVDVRGSSNSKEVRGIRPSSAYPKQYAKDDGRRKATNTTPRNATSGTLRPVDGDESMINNDTTTSLTLPCQFHPINNNNADVRSSCSSKEARGIRPSSVYPKQDVKGGGRRTDNKYATPPKSAPGTLRSVHEDKSISSNNATTMRTGRSRENSPTRNDSGPELSPDVQPSNLPRRDQDNDKRRREQRRLQKGADQGKDKSKILPGRTPTTSVKNNESSSTYRDDSERETKKEEQPKIKMSDLGEHTAVDMSHPQMRARRRARLEKEADQGNQTAISPTRHQNAATTIPSSFAYQGYDDPEAQLQNQNGLISDDGGGDSKPRNFRDRRHFTEENPFEDNDSDSTSVDSDIVPGAYKVTIEGMERRPSKLQPTSESQRFSGSGFSHTFDSSRGSGTSSVQFHGSKRESSKVSGSERSKLSGADISSKASALQEDRPSVTNASPTSNDDEAPVAINGEEANSKKSAWKKAFLLIAACLVLVVAAVPLALRDEEPTTPQLATSPPTTTPTISPTTFPTFPTLSTRAKEFINILKSFSAESSLLDPSQPQSMAVTWLADMDELRPRLNPVESEMDIILERYVMALLHYAWNPQFTFSGFRSESGVCGWNDAREIGIFCDDDGHVSRIQLSQQQLKGSIPSEIFSLPKLETMILSLNQLTGTIPKEIGLRTTLRNIDVWRTQRLRGTIPESIESLSHLETLLLGSTDLSGSIPASVFTASSLTEFSIRNTEMTGTIPTEIHLLSSLEIFDIVNTRFVSTIPIGIGSLGELRILELGAPLLTGSIPSEIGMLSNLRSLRLDYTSLESTIPTEFGRLRYLSTLRMEESPFLHGSIPIQIKELSFLTQLNLGNTGLTDESNVVEQLCLTNQPPQGEELDFSICATDISCSCCTRNCNR